MTQEKDPLGKSTGEPGAKLDLGKSPVYRGCVAYFPRALMEVALVSAYGSQKYSWQGWRSVPNGINRYKDALGRHICKEGIEGVWDLEILNDPKYPGRIRHLAQVCWNALAALELELDEEQTE